MSKEYYKAYDDRYRQIHARGLTWFDDRPSPVVGETMDAFGVEKCHRILEIGCGEGRDAAPLLREGYNLLATDVSPRAIDYCRERYPEYKEHFRVLDCVGDDINDRFDFIYAVAVVHMLVKDEDRNAFYRFIQTHLTPTGIALICTMGDGSTQRRTDPSTAFELQERVHEQSGKTVQVAGTSCCMVSFETFREELMQNGLTVLREGIADSVPGFSHMMTAVVRANPQLQFRKPNRGDVREIEAFKQEFATYGSGMDGTGTLVRCGAEEWLRDNARMERGEDPQSVPCLQYGLFEKGTERLLGMLQIRLELKGYLVQFGGHIGYCVRPTERRRGYAKFMLRQALEICRMEGLEWVLVTCLADNVGSERTIRSCGGIYDKTVYDGQNYHANLKRFYISL